MQQRALEGVKVADFTWIAAGPLTMSYLAQCGATIVKVESVKAPDSVRTFPPSKDGITGINRSLVFSNENANKFGMTVNLNHPRGIEVAKKLVAWADIVAENYRPGTMERWGLGYDDLKRINPSIIMFRSSAQGQTGPDSGMGANGITLQSLSGFTFLSGWPDRDPTPPWGAYTDLTAPAFGAAMLIAAIAYRARTGKGQCIDLSQYEAGLHFLAPAILDYFINGRCATRSGNSCPYAAPHGVYKCAGDDRWCAIAVFNDIEWKAFCEAIGKPEWLNDSRFRTVADRKENEAQLNSLIEEWTINHTAEEVMTLLQGHGISAGVVENSADLFQDPQIKERQLFKQLEHDEIGRVSHRGVGFKLSKTPCEFSTPGPRLGQHVEYVCRHFLGMSDEEFVSLLNDGALN
jgi:benzylsuccinate CoA-transferase BbsF subunit